MTPSRIISSIGTATAPLVMDALRLARMWCPKAPGLFADFVRFSLDLQRLDGRDLPPPTSRSRISRKFLRRDLGQAHGAEIGAETRVNPDGTLDITDWPRPQHDGPALRALCLMRWGVPGDDAAASAAPAILLLSSHHARRPCFGIWEEEKGLHYYTLRGVGGGAGKGRRLACRRADETALAALCRDEADAFCAIAGGLVAGGSRLHPRPYVWSNAAPKRNWTCR